MFVDSSEAHRSGGGGVRNHVSQCHFCKEGITINMLEDSSCLRASHGSGGSRGVTSLGSYCPDLHTEGGIVVQLDMRGAEPVELRLDDQWEVEGTSGTVFQGVDISESWYDYDEAAGSAISIGGVSITFHRVRK